MKDCDINIPDENENEQCPDVPKEIQEMVLERLRTSKRENLLTWEEVKAKLKFT